jgi:hypothetical protein
MHQSKLNLNQPYQAMKLKHNSLLSTKKKKKKKTLGHSGFTAEFYHILKKK